MRGGVLEEGTRIGRFVVLRDQDGTNMAVAAGAVAAVCETTEGVIILLSGGKVLCIPHAMKTVLEWLDGRP